MSKKSKKVIDILKCFFDVFENDNIFKLNFPIYLGHNRLTGGNFSDIFGRQSI